MAAANAAGIAAVLIMRGPHLLGVGPRMDKSYADFGVTMGNRTLSKSSIPRRLSTSG
jgi:hypothetical protein